MTSQGGYKPVERDWSFCSLCLKPCVRSTVTLLSTCKKQNKLNGRKWSGRGFSLGVAKRTPAAGADLTTTTEGASLKLCPPNVKARLSWMEVSAQPELRELLSVAPWWQRSLSVEAWRQ
jgi:hypothetical protein